MTAAITPRLQADPLADQTVARCVGPLDGGHWERIAILNRLIGQWDTNGALANWQAPPGTPAPLAAALQDYVANASRLPDWADPVQIARAEQLFMDMSVLSCTLLFCASLPECYVMPDLAAVLHAAGQLEAHTDYRIRSTAAMIFPVMMPGGLTQASGGGVAQALKVRLIHATIRYLILRGEPAQALQLKLIPPLPAQGDSMHAVLYRHGWGVEQHGLPCNQEELAYTLLTFHYIFVRGLQRLGLGLAPQDEQAYLHAWNVLGHVIGIERALMPDAVPHAQAQFAAIQQRAEPCGWQPDPRPALATALMQEMENEIPLRVLKPIPVLLTRYLCGKAASEALGLTQRVSLLSRALFALGMGLVRTLDTVVRLFVPGFSLARMGTRLLGEQLVAKLLMDQTRPLKLPDALLNQVQSLVRSWKVKR